MSFSNSSSQSYASNFAFLGYDSQLLVVNDGSLVIFITVLFIFATLGMMSLHMTGLAYKKYCRKFIVWSKKKLFFGAFIRIALEGSLEILIAGMINI